MAAYPDLYTQVHAAIDRAERAAPGSSPYRVFVALRVAVFLHQPGRDVCVGNCGWSEPRSDLPCWTFARIANALELDLPAALTEAIAEESSR